MMKGNQWAWSVLGMAVVCGHMLYIINAMIGFSESSLLTAIVMYYRHYAQSKMSINGLYADTAHVGLRHFGVGTSNEYDYPDCVNKIPFHDLYNRIELRYVDYGGVLSESMPYVRMGDIVPYNETKDHSDILLVFGGSSNHIVTVLSGILSFVYHFPYSPLLFVDFGATQEEVCWLKYVFTMVHQYHDAMSMSIPIYYRIYDWDHFPDWMHITKALNHGGYTWKPIAIADAFFQWKGVIMWNDAGNYYGN